MLSIVGLSDPDIEGICKKVLAAAPAGTICQMANFLFPQVGDWSLPPADCWNVHVTSVAFVAIGAVAAAAAAAATTVAVNASAFQH